MKGLSIKFKVTLWFTLMMILIVAAVLSFLFQVGERIVFEETHTKLLNAVNDSFNEIKYRFHELDIDDDLDYYNEGVYIAVYDTEERLIYGRLPSDFDYSLPFSDTEIQTIGEGEHTKYIYDEARDVGHGYIVIVRGVLSASGSEHAFSAMLKLASIIFPALIVITAVMGYFLTKRAFMPVKQIADSAKQINSGNDLSKRIGLKDGNDEIHQLANSFDMMFDRLQESFENEKRFTSDASHELRTPLSVIIAQSEAALDDPATQDEARESLNIIHEKAANMSSLISALLMLARADRGHLKLKKETVDFSLVCQAVLEQAKEIAAEKGIIVTGQIEQNVLVAGDETMLIRLLLNLCENGIKYGRLGGSLDISLKKANGFAECRIEDDGIGISEENKKYIWERFYRVDAARTDGSGLGLPLAKYIAEAHEGNITLKTELGSGSVFCVEIPVID